MKTRLLFALLSLIQPTFVTGADSQSKVPWRYFTSGKYHVIRTQDFEKGVESIDKRNYEFAYRCFRASLTTTHKFNYPGYNNYAIAAAMIGKYDQAIGLLNKSVMSGGDPAVAGYNIFICLMNSGKYEEALYQLQLLPFYIIAAHPKESGDCYVQNKMFREAYNCLRYHIETDSAAVDHKEYFNASLAAWEMNDSTKAVEYITYAIESKPRIAKYWSQIAKYQLVTDPAEAVQSFHKAITLSNGNDTELLTGLGYAYLSTGNGEKAAKIFEQLILQVEKANPDFFQLLATAQLQSNQLKNALDNMIIVSNLRSYNQQDERIIGEIYLNLDSLTNAKTHLLNSLAFGFDPEAAFGMAIVNFLNDDVENSMNCFRQIEYFKPDYQLSTYAQFVRAMLYYSSGRYDALSSYLSSGEFGKNKEASRLLISAMKSMITYRYDEAARILRKAIKIEPDNVNLILMRGVLLFQTGQASEAADVFEDALKIDTGNVEIMNCLALALSNKGNHFKALELMKKVLSQNGKPRFYNNMALVLMKSANYHMANKDSAIADSLNHVAISYVDTSLQLGASEDFIINKAICYYNLRDTANWNKWNRYITSPFSYNNQSVAAFYNGEKDSSIDLIDEAVNSSMGTVCPYIQQNVQIIKGCEGTQRVMNPSFIYLFQSMPAVLPKTHTFQYTYRMPASGPEQITHEFKTYRNLNGEILSANQNSVAMR